MSPVDVLRHADAESLADAAAGRTVTTLVDAIASAGIAHLCLTGGGIGTAVLAAIGDGRGREAVDWGAVHIWWGDERYLPQGDPERNETSARAALLDRISIPPEHVHAIPGPDRSDGDLERAAESYATEMGGFARPEDHAPVPSMDVLMLGIGPDAHVASLFPENPALRDARPVVGVRGAPKPPPTRISLSFDSINAARQVWVLASGDAKAHAIRMALTEGVGRFEVPASGVRGRERTLFLLDEAAAGELPADLGRPGA